MTTTPFTDLLRSRGTQADPEAPIVLEHREALIYTLGKAAELEHLVMCQYLYAAFSLKQSEKECIPTFLVPLSRITDALRASADRLGAARGT